MQLPPRQPRKILEADIVEETIVRLSALEGVRVRRNNTGQLYDRFGTPVKYGLGNGAPDILGIITVITRDGPLACAFGVEMKTPKAFRLRDHNRSDDQRAWASAAESRGMPVWCAESADMAAGSVVTYRDFFLKLVCR